MTQPDAPIGAIDLSAQTLVFPLSSEMSVFEYGMALCATRIFGFISLIILCVFISRKCYNRILTICILAAILFFPVCLYLADVELVKVFSLFDLIMGNLFLQKTFSTVKIILLMLMDMLMIISIHREMKEE